MGGVSLWKIHGLLLLFCVKDVNHCPIYERKRVDILRALFGAIRSNKVEIAESAGAARRWTAAIVLVFIGIKVALFVSEKGIRLEHWEWLLVPFAITYQHIMMALPIFVIYFLIFFLGTRWRPLRYAAIGIVSLCQLVLTLLHIASLRVAHILGSFPTFEMTDADSEGSVFTAEILAPENLKYVIPALAAAAAAIALPLLLRRYSFRPKWRPNLTILMGFLLFIGIGMASERGIKSYLGVANADPVVFYFADLAEKRMGMGWLRYETAGQMFATEAIYGPRQTVPTKSLFGNLEAFRKTNMNVVLIVMESLPVKQASFMRPVRVNGQVRDTLPNLRKMRRHMLTMENHYSVHPSSMNALFSIGCSLYPYPAGGTITNVNPRIPCRSISEVFGDLGYQTALFHTGRFSFWKKRKFYDNRGFKVMRDATNMPGYKKAKKFHWGIDELVTADAVAKFIQTNKEVPFFIQYLVLFPHAPYDYPEGDYATFPNQTKQDKYHNSLRYVDAALKRVTDQLRQLKLLKDTLIAVVGDHGEAFNEHKGNRVHSIFIYEENIHVPFALFNPILFDHHVETKKITSHIDILPTIADIVGGARGEYWQGTSLLRDSPSPMAYFFANFGQKILGLRDGPFKVLWNTRKGDWEMYNLEKDQREKNNLAETFNGRIPAYRKALSTWESYQSKLIRTLGKEDVAAGGK